MTDTGSTVPPTALRVLRALAATPTGGMTVRTLHIAVRPAQGVMEMAQLLYKRGLVGEYDAGFYITDAGREALR